MASDVQLKTPGGSLTYEFEWQDQVPNGVTLLNVVHSAPPPLQIQQSEYDSVALISKVRISGGVHGALYVVTAIANLSTGEGVPGQFTLRVMQPPNVVNV